MLIIISSQKQEPLAVCESDAGGTVYVEKDDNAAIRRLKDEAVAYDLAANDGHRLECYLILNDSTTLWLLQTVGLPEEIEEKVDVFATTQEDWLAKTVFVKMPSNTSVFPSLDRVAISRDSETTVHLVILGFSAQTEALAINAALVAHYPNYCRDTRLRTRITIIDDNVFDGRDRLIQRYVHLFENSYYRTIDLFDSNPECSLNTPKYLKSRKDFVDIEWEFVNGNVRCSAVRQKLVEWSYDSHQQLTVMICHSDQNRNYTESLGLPQDIYDNKIPILCYTDDSDVLSMVSDNGTYTSVHPFGRDICEIRTLCVLKSLAQRVNYVYNHCFALGPADPITAPSEIDEDKLEYLWRQVGSLPKKYSNIFNAMTLGTKMHSVGHSSDDWKEYYALNIDEISILAEVEHNRWCVEELILGYRPVSDTEQALVEKDISQKKILRKNRIHYDLRAYDDLRDDSTGKNVNVYDLALTQGIPLIIKTCITD
ncbi:MAG: hypothetical protein J6W42_00190 [Bacteroidaceae bacterium]|nr:hypothetical protein [Bacteroidaceae bacterium]